MSHGSLQFAPESPRSAHTASNMVYRYGPYRLQSGTPVASPELSEGGEPMSIFDPMTIGNAAMTGVLQFGIGPSFWGVLLGTLSAAGLAILLSGRRQRRGPRIALAPRVAAGVGRAH
jgi:hypothetical protein